MKPRIRRNGCAVFGTLQVDRTLRRVSAAFSKIWTVRTNEDKAAVIKNHSIMRSDESAYVNTLRGTGLSLATGENMGDH